VGALVDLLAAIAVLSRCLGVGQHADAHRTLDPPKALSVCSRVNQTPRTGQRPNDSSSSPSPVPGRPWCTFRRSGSA